MSELEYLSEELNKIDSYPAEMEAVNCKISGLGFFPGAKGLSIANDEKISDKAIMILGHDFGSKKDYELSVKRGEENQQALTWKNLNYMLEKFGISKNDCFLTNAIMGVRVEGSALGKSPAYKHPMFLKDCLDFLIKQINIQRPKVIMVLGLNVLEILSDLAPSLIGLRKIRSFKKLDYHNLSYFNNIEFDSIPDYKTSLAIITHPTYYHLNAKHRRYNGLEGVAAEEKIIRDALEII